MSIVSSDTGFDVKITPLHKQCGEHKNGLTLVCCGDEGIKHKSVAVDLLISVHSYPPLWLQALAKAFSEVWLAKRMRGAQNRGTIPPH